MAARTNHSVLVGDDKGRVLWANQAFERITGFAASEVIGHNPVRLLQAADADPQVVQRMRDAQAGGEGVRLELLTRNRSGREYWLTKMQAVVAALWDEALTPEALQTDEGRGMMTPALKFWKSMAPGLKAEAEEWKKAQGLAGRGRGGIMR